ncbi:MAG: hypothetical protein KatS3mg111_1310 [Pirellulaceae bacterium]|nr:MAG: hypothetical protein KatS3mg111_1310 [Pirellulaceae bacterium]
MERQPSGIRDLLIVDDDPDIRINLRDIFEDLGFSIDTAVDAQEALTLARSRRYQVLLVDFRMPGMDGVRLVEQMQHLCPEAVPIMITAHLGSSEFPDRAQDLRFPVLPKPIDVGRLLPLVEKALAG